MKVTICGTGYVGLTTGVLLAYLGHDVVCYDIDQAKVDTLKKGIPYFYEPHLEEMLGIVRENISFSSDAACALGGADVVFIAVGTPSGPSGSADLTVMKQVTHSIGKHLGADFTLVVNKSTAPIGSGDWVHSLLSEAMRERFGASGDKRFAVCSNPEFMRQGSALYDNLYPDRVVVGSDNPMAIRFMRSLYSNLLDQSFAAPACLPRPEAKTSVPLVETDFASAELIKYASNAFLSMKISFINEIASLAEKVGADVTAVSKGIGLDRRIGPSFLNAGVGWGGSCFGKDSSALIRTGQEYGLDMKLLSASRSVNYRQRLSVVEKLLTELKTLRGKSIGLLGLSFKPNTDDLRDAPALDIVRSLQERGARVRAFDPVAMKKTQKEYPDLAIEYCDSAEQVFDHADAILVITEWPEFLSLDWGGYGENMKRRVVVDGRNCLDREKLAESGFHYIGIGR